MSVETHTNKRYVYIGAGAIRTEDGLRVNIDSESDMALSFVASPGWLRRHKQVAHLLVAYADYQTGKAKADQATADMAKKPDVAVKPKRRKKR